MENRGLVTSLFDLSFTHLVTLKLVKAFYVVGVAVTLLLAIVQFFIVTGAIFSIMDGGFFALVVSLIVAPLWTALVTLLALILLRVMAEGIILIYRIADYLRAIDGKMPAPASTESEFS